MTRRFAIYAWILLTPIMAVEVYLKTDIDPLTPPNNYPKKKERESEEINAFGEDYAGLTPKGLAVCDGVGGSRFYSYFAAKMMCLFVQKHMMDLYIKASTVATVKKKEENPGDFVISELIEGFYFTRMKSIVNKTKQVVGFPILLHRALVYNFIISRHTILNTKVKTDRSLSPLFNSKTPIENVEMIAKEIVLDIDTSSEIEQTLKKAISIVASMETLIKSIISSVAIQDFSAFSRAKRKQESPIGSLISSLNSFGFESEEIESSALFTKFQSMSTTLIFAEVLPVQESDDVKVLAVRQLGDSLLTILKPRRHEKESYVVYEPFFFTFDVQSESSTLRRFNTPGQSSFTSDKFDDKFTGSMMQIEPGDIVIAGSDGVFDSMPLSLMALLINAAIVNLLDSSTESLSQSTIDTIIVNVLTEYFSATMYRSKADIQKLKLLNYLQIKPKEFGHDEDPFASCRSCQFKELSELSLSEIFFVEYRTFNGYREPKSLLSKCMSNYLEKFKIENTAEVTRRFSPKVMSDLISRATRVMTQMNEFLSELNEFHGGKAQSKFESPVKQSKPTVIATEMRNSKLLTEKSHLPSASKTSTNQGLQHRESAGFKAGSTRVSKASNFLPVISTKLGPKIKNTQTYEVPLEQKPEPTAFSVPVYQISASNNKEADTRKMAEQVVAYLKDMESKGKLTAAENQKKIVSLFRIRESIYRQEEKGIKIKDQDFDVIADEHKSDDITAIVSVVDTEEPSLEMFNGLETLKRKKEQFNHEFVNQLKQYSQHLYDVIEKEYMDQLGTIDIKPLLRELI